jgi:hypothetical protein
MRRAMQVLKGMGPQESTKTYPYPYDHPYFGQLFLAAGGYTATWTCRKSRPTNGLCKYMIVVTKTHIEHWHFSLS